MASKGKAAPKRAPKKKNGYEMPKPLKPADILTDNQKNQWKVGVSIGVGGFGEIYSACKASAVVKKVEDYPYVVKIVSCIQSSQIGFNFTISINFRNQRRMDRCLLR